MGAFSRRLDQRSHGRTMSPLQISVFNAVPAAFPADRTASGFPVRFHAPDALSNRESTGLLRFSTSVSTVCGKLKERKNPISAVHLHRRKICGVESAVEDCGMRFPQPVQSTTPCGRVFHEILHKLSLSTPQFFPFPRRKNFSTFPDSFHECPVGKKSPEFPAKSWVSTFPGSLLVLLYLFYLSILSFCSFAASFLE